MKACSNRVITFFAVLQLALSYSAWGQFSPPSGGLVGWWKADGNANDSSGNGHDGILLSGVAFDTGKYGQAFSFGGNPNRVFIPDSPDFNLTNSLTIAAWVYPKADSWHVFERATTGFVPYTLGLDDAGHFWFVINSQDGHSELLAPAGDYNQWKQITATLDGQTGEMRLYIDGTLATNQITTVRPSALSAASQPATAIGNTPYGGGFPFIGLVDDVVLYSRALSPEEVQQLAHPRAEVLQILTLRMTTFTQGTNYDNGTNTIAALPKVKTLDTADLLRTLARDENAAGRWPSNTFPSNAKLAAGSPEGFRVVSGTNTLVNVSDIISFSGGGNDIRSGKESDATGLANPMTKSLRLGKLTFDDTSIPGGVGLKFFIQGLLSSAETDTVPSGGVYTQTKTGKMISGTGEGTDSDGNAFVLTGTVTVAGHGKVALAP